LLIDINNKFYNLHLSSTFDPFESSFTKPWETSSNNIESRLVFSSVSLVNSILGFGTAFVSETFASNKNIIGIKEIL